MLLRILNYIVYGIGIIVCLSVLIYQIHRTYHSFQLGQRRKNLKRSAEKVVIIGASSGIGRDLALQYAQRGASLILVARREELLEELSQRCKEVARSEGLEIAVHPFAWDITRYERGAELANLVATQFHTLDTLILNAGVISVLKFSELVSDGTIKPSTLSDRLESVHGIMSVNYISFVHITAHLLKYLEESTAGNIVVVSSAAGVVGTPTRSLYSASKHALHGFYNSIRMELEAASSRVHIAIICPGSVDTKLRLSSIDGSKLNVSPESVAGVASGKLSSYIVAERIISASDASEELVFIPPVYRHTVWLAHFFPSIVAKLARKKYGL